MTRKHFRFGLPIRAAFPLAIAALVCAVHAKTISFPAQTGQTLDEAFLWAANGDTIMVRDGTYRGSFFVKTEVVLKAENPGMAVFEGGGKGIVMTLGSGARIEGLTITDGTIGVFSKYAKNAIHGCRIVRNWESGIVCVRHLPEITNNVIAFNRASGIKCYGIKSTAAASAVSHNVIAYNRRNGLTVDGPSEAIVQYNIIAYNLRYGMHYGAKSRLTVDNNDFFGNLTTFDPLPKGNFSYDPRFISAKAGALDFSSQGKCSECVPEKMPGLQDERTRQQQPY